MKRERIRAARAAIWLMVWLGLGTAGCNKAGGGGSEEDAPTTSRPLKYGQSVSGKVTWKGEPVPYGMVIFYSIDRVDPRTAAHLRLGAAKIAKDGSYEVTNTAAGTVYVVVATDPDLNVAQIMLRTPSLGQPGPPPGAGAPGTPSEFLPKPPPKAEARVATPASSEDPEAARITEVEKLTDAQKKCLKLIHDKYGSPERARMFYVVHEGAQVHDIKLK